MRRSLAHNHFRPDKHFPQSLNELSNKRVSERLKPNQIHVYRITTFVHVQCRFYNTVVFYEESGTVACIFLRRLIQIICYWSGSACMNNYWPVGLSYTMRARCLHNDAHAALATGSCRLSKQSCPLKLQSVLTRSLT